MKPEHAKAARRRLLSTQQVARALAVKPATVNGWITSGALPAVRRHREWHVWAEELERLLLSDQAAS